MKSNLKHFFENVLRKCYIFVRSDIFAPYGDRTEDQAVSNDTETHEPDKELPIRNFSGCTIRFFLPSSHGRFTSIILKLLMQDNAVVVMVNIPGLVQNSAW